MKRALCILAFLLINIGLGTADNTPIHIAIILPDNYHQLGESVAISTQEALKKLQIDAAIK